MGLYMSLYMNYMRFLWAPFKVEFLNWCLRGTFLLLLQEINRLKSNPQQTILSPVLSCLDCDYLVVKDVVSYSGAQINGVYIKMNELYDGYPFWRQQENNGHDRNYIYVHNYGNDYRNYHLFAQLGRNVFHSYRSLNQSASQTESLRIKKR